MNVGTIAKILEAWAPKELAWEKDNVGLQVGNAMDSVEKILVALDVTEHVIAEAANNNVQLIVSHHPLLFRPLQSVTSNDRVGNLVRQLIQKNIAVYSAHTNLDFTARGVSFALAEELELENVQFLVPLAPMQKKIVVFVPKENVEAVATAMGNAGAGQIGNYEWCSFRGEGTGTFRGNEYSKPFFGTAEQYETVNEVRLEMVVPKWKLSSVLDAMKEAHPYEEVAFDVYPLENGATTCGMGAIGMLHREVSEEDFLRFVKRKLQCSALKFSKGKTGKIFRVAVCGGSGAEFLSSAIAKNADAYVTADIAYHPFHDAEGKLLLIDAGHYETERVILSRIAETISRSSVRMSQSVEVLITESTTSAIHWIY
ncbi:MAG: Nif3-like dinuclear metal center hexameric protein [Ignavibacteria bacterium]|nr:Nif3-like dinuclear metal center hexameric protein [Ignavibacteria bacterium]